MKGFFLEKDTKEKSKANWPYLVIGKEMSKHNIGIARGINLNEQGIRAASWLFTNAA